MLGTRIRELRKEKNLTLSHLARKTGISKSYLSQMERNIQTNPSVEVVLKIAKVLEVPIQDLVVLPAKGIKQETEPKKVIKDWNDLICSGLKAGIIDEKFLEEIIKANQKEDKRKK
ncbi:helix-turn-helix domain-containing protein [Peribacillus sp. SCS-155]|uniref:helix-turn-helix domain-containing protein n=1 Tax=Peribacillus sedimenti TaxID=3115297 RepID=UPI003905E66F